MIPPIRVLDEVDAPNIYSRYVFGANLFRFNNVGVVPEADPRVAFMAELTRSLTLTAHVGPHGLVELADSIEEVLLRPREWIPTPWTVSNGDLWSIPRGESPAFLFPGGLAPGRDVSHEAVHTLLWYDALAVYIARGDRPVDTIDVVPPDAVERSDAALAWLLDACRCLVFSEGDGWQFHAMARDPTDFACLDSAIDAASECVGANEWYREHRDHLVWRGDPDFCLTVPAESPSCT